jgi:hypothetical protein
MRIRREAAAVLIAAPRLAPVARADNLRDVERLPREL